MSGNRKQHLIPAGGKVVKSSGRRISVITFGILHFVFKMEKHAVDERYRIRKNNIRKKKDVYSNFYLSFFIKLNHIMITMVSTG
jgi:hypothetical protein